MKKKLKTIRPTLRHKKRYVLLKLFNTNINLEPKRIYFVLSSNLQKNSGIFIQIESNISILEIDENNKTILVRVNKNYLDEFISSLFFSQQELGLIKILNIKTTIRKIKENI